MSDTDPSATLAQLSTSLTALEQALDPLLATPLEQHLEQNSLDPLVQARAQVLASYVVHDLVWVYLKAAGVEPAAHPVMQEIERLKGYFGKLKAAQNGGAVPPSAPSRPRMQLDKAAANRFISAAIASQRAKVDPNYTSADDTDDVEMLAGGTHTRFEETEAEKEDLDRLLEDEEEESESLTSSEEGEEDEEDSVVEEMLRGARTGLENAKKTRKQVDLAAGTGAGVGGKKQGTGKRRAMDPFAGYDQPKSSSAPAAADNAPATPRAASNAAAAAAPPSSESGKRKRKDVAAAAPAPSAGGEEEGTSTTGKSKQKRKKLKLKGAK
ncbi:hypothetical protein JCM10908_003701 [Rhodotorula pacifica]|uniref:Sas10/Utp3/C1D family protein n=1 Tax=Rhodotorula pacifica TaxID=1495444 RepID=UPI0031765E9A